MEIIDILQVSMVISIVSLGLYTLLSLSDYYIHDKISISTLALACVLILVFIMINSMVMVELDKLKRLLE